MRSGRPKVALILTKDERRRLDSLAHRSRSAPHVARRARIILACADGTDSNVVARRLHVTPATGCKWRGGLLPPRPGAVVVGPAPRPPRRGTADPSRRDGSRSRVTPPAHGTH